MNDLKIRGRAIRSDENGLICLTDIWEAAGFSKNQRPAQWQRLDSSQKLMSALLDRIVGKSHNSKKYQLNQCIIRVEQAGHLRTLFWHALTPDI